MTPASWTDPHAYDDDGNILYVASEEYLRLTCGPPPPDAAVTAAIEAAVAKAVAALQPAGRDAAREDAASGDLRALVTIAEARALLRCSDRQVRRLVATGDLRSVRGVRAGSSRVLIPRESLLAFLAERRR